MQSQSRGPQGEPTCPGAGWGLVLSALLSVGAALARGADGASVLPTWLHCLLQAPLIVAWVAAWARRDPNARTGADLALFLLLLAGAVAIAVHRREPSLALLAVTVFITGALFLDALKRIYVRLDGLADQPRAILRCLGARWLLATAAAIALLTLPLASSAAVQDYRHAHLFANHLLNNTFAALSAACLYGNMPYDLARDYTPFGQAVLFVLGQLSGLAFCAIGLAAVRPLLSRPPRLKTILLLAIGLQLGGAAVLASVWRDADAPTLFARCWQGLVYASDAIFSAGLSVGPRGLAPYVHDRAAFITITILAVAGSIGLPLVLDVLRKPRPSPAGARARADGSRGIRPIAHFETGAALVLMMTAAGLLFAFETPALLPESWTSALPFDLGEHAVALGDEPSAAGRWRRAVFAAATIRSAGLESIAVTQGAVSRPSYVLLVLLMFVGGSAGGAAGGARTTAIVLFLSLLLARNHRRAALTGGDSSTRDLVRRIGLFLLTWALLHVAATAALYFATGASARDVVFEAAAALNSVDLSTDLVLHLTPAGRASMIALVTAGRWIPVWFWIDLAARMQQESDGSARPVQPKQHRST